MRKCQSDQSVFSSMTERGSILLIAYVNDIIIIGGDTQSIEELIGDTVIPKTWGRLRYFLGIEVAWSKEESVCPKDVCSGHFIGNSLAGDQACRDTYGSECEVVCGLR